MEFNWHNIKKLMQEDHDQPLPPELDWSKMKDGIFEKMQAIEQGQSSRRNGRKRIGLFLLLLLIGSCGLYRISQNWNQDPDPGTSAVVLSSRTEMDQSARDMKSMPAPADLTEDAAELQAQDSREEKSSGLSQTDSEPGFVPGQTQSAGAEVVIGGPAEHATVNQSSPVNGQTDSRGDRSGHENRGAAAIHDLNQHDLTTMHDPDRMGIVQSVDGLAQSDLALTAVEELLGATRQIAELYPLPPFPLIEFPVEARNFSVAANWNIDSTDLPTIPRAKYPDQLVVEGGLTFWNQGYGNRKPERAQYETPLTSFQVQGSYLKRFKGSYFAMGGLQYQQLESKFEFNETLQDYQVTLTDTIVQVQNDLLSGAQTIIRGDVQQSVQALHRIRHYNRSQLFKVSAGIGKSWRANGFQVDAYLGGALNTLVHNQGRTYDGGVVIDYDGASNAVFKNQWTVDAVLGARLHYLITQNISVTAGFQTQKSLMNWSNREDVRFYPISFGLQLGLSYTFQ